MVKRHGVEGHGMLERLIRLYFAEKIPEWRNSLNKAADTIGSDRAELRRIVKKVLSEKLDELTAD